MIEPLTGHDVWGVTLGGTPGVIGTAEPDNREIVEKINEIIEVLNKLTEPKEQANEQNTPDDGKNTCKESRCSTGSVWPSAE